MGFRNEEEARFHRVQALETELEERDREIAALRAKLEGKTETTGRAQEEESVDPSATTAKGSGSALTGGVAGDRWVIDTHQVHRWLVDAVSLMASGVMGTFLAMEFGLLVDAWPALIFTAPGLMFFYRQRLTLDRRAGTVTRAQSLLVVRWNRVVTYAGKELLVEQGSVTPKSGESSDTGTAYLDGMKLFSKKMEPAKALAERIAAFLDIPCRVVAPSREGLQRRVETPLRLAIGAGGVVMAFFLLRELFFR